MSIAAVGVIALAGGGGDGGEAAAGGTVRLSWAEPPLVNTPPMLKRDRVLAGKLRNESLRDVDLVAADVRLLDAEGRPVRSTARFLAAYTHGLYAPAQRPDTPNPNEQKQLGEIVTIKSRQVVPVTLSWRVPAGAERPVTADLGPASLALP